MKYYSCRFSSASSFGRFASICIYPGIAVLLLLSTIFVFHDILHRSPQLIEIVKIMPFWSAVLLLSMYLFKVGYLSYHMENRKIAFDQFGFSTVDQGSKKYSWSDVHSIGILMFAASASKQHYQNTICIFLKPVDDRMLRSLRDSYLYGVLNQKDIVILDYDAIMYDSLNKTSGISIPDFRAKQMIM